MPIDILVLSQAAIGLCSAVKAVAKSVEKLSTAVVILWNNRELKKVRKELQRVSQRLTEVGTAAESLEQYVKSYVHTAEIAAASNKLHQVLVAENSVLDNPDSRAYRYAWAHIATLFGDLRKSQSSYVRVQLSRLAFLDARDQTDIQNQIREFNDGLVRAEGYLSSRDAKAFEDHIQRLNSRAQKLLGIFEDSTGKLLDNLARIKE